MNGEPRDTDITGGGAAGQDLSAGGVTRFDDMLGPYIEAGLELPPELLDEQRLVFIRPGDVVADRFQVVKPLGFGGMGAVYHVKDCELGTDKALKVMLPSLLRSQTARDRFRSEVSISQELAHDRIVRVHDLMQDTRRGIQFFTMEYVPGVTLHRYLKDKGGRLPVDEALDVARQICDALEYAHKYTVHRDLKPQNIMVRPDGRIKILDFGLAKLMTPGRFTKSSMALGTAYYQAPEQSTQVGEVDARADIYSLGVILYQMLTGIIPTAGAEPPAKEAPGIPKRLDAVVLTCLKRQKDRRYNSAAGLRAALDEAVSPRRIRWAYAAIFAVVAVALAGLGMFLLVSTGRGETGPLQAASTWMQQGGKSPVTAALAHINSDNMVDVLLGDSNGTLLAMDGEKGKLIFSAQVSDQIVAPALPADLNGDGKADVVVGNLTGTVTVFTAYRDEGKILWRSSPDLDLGAVTNRPAAWDLNGDKIPDILVPTANKGLVALDGKAGWMLWQTGEIFPDAVVGAPLVADLDGDGTMDFASVTKSGIVGAVSANDNKVWKLWIAQTGPVNNTSAAFMDRGEVKAVIVAAEDGVWAFNAGSGRSLWHADLSGPFTSSPIAVEATGDGKHDVVVVSEMGLLYVLDGGTGDVFSSLDMKSGITASPALFDFNRDKVTDLVVLDTSGYLHVVDLNRGRELLKPVAIPDADGFSASPVLGDLTNDGYLEALCAAVNGKIVAMTFNRRIARSKVIWPLFLGNDRHAE